MLIALLGIAATVGQPTLPPVPMQIPDMSTPTSVLRSSPNWRICVSRRSGYPNDERHAACTALLEAGQLDPRSLSMVYVCRGLTFNGFGHRAAYADYEAAIQADPSYAWGYNNRGYLRYRRGDRQGAAADFDMALRLDPSLMLPWYNRGRLRLDLGDAAGAVDDLSAAIARMRRRDLDPEVYRVRARAYRRLGQRALAAADLRDADRMEEMRNNPPVMTPAVPPRPLPPRPTPVVPARPSPPAPKPIAANAGSGSADTHPTP